MTDDTVTNWRSRFALALAWAKAHPGVTIPLLAFLTGAVVGAWVF